MHVCKGSWHHLQLACSSVQQNGHRHIRRCVLMGCLYISCVNQHVLSPCYQQGVGYEQHSIFIVVLCRGYLISSQLSVDLTKTQLNALQRLVRANMMQAIKSHRMRAARLCQINKLVCRQPACDVCSAVGSSRGLHGTVHVDIETACCESIGSVERDSS